MASEQVLREQVARLELALQGARTGVLDWDVSTGDMFFSEGWLSLTGYAPGELAPRVESLTALVHPDDLGQAMADLVLVIEGKKEQHDFEHRLRHKLGHWMWIESRGTVSTRDAAGRAVRMIGSHRDVTERKHAELANVRLEAQLRQAQKMESVGRLAGGVAHDFNNMLAVILGAVELAVGQVDPASSTHAELLEIRRAAQRSADLTRQLLAFARKQAIAPRVLDLNATIEGMLRLLRRLIGEDIELRWAPGGHLPEVRVDPSQIDQILANLCVNARDAIGGVGHVTIATEAVTLDEAYCARDPRVAPGEYARLVVTDDGCGMDRETLAHLFEPFFTTKPPGQGTGLGLATVYGIAEQNGGVVRVQSAPGAGTRFEVDIPAFRQAAGPPAGEAEAGPTARGHETILLVEDEPALLRLTRRLLEEMGYAVLAAASPDEARRLAREHRGPIHLLLTDVIMPGMNGPSLARRLREGLPGLRRVFMSGYTASAMDDDHALDDGVHFLAKPFSGRELAAVVRAALDAEPG